MNLNVAMKYCAWVCSMAIIVNDAIALPTSSTSSSTSTTSTSANFTSTTSTIPFSTYTTASSSSSSTSSSSSSMLSSSSSSTSTGPASSSSTSTWVDFVDETDAAKAQPAPWVMPFIIGIVSMALCGVTLGVFMVMRCKEKKSRDMNSKMIDVGFHIDDETSVSAESSTT